MKEYENIPDHIIDSINNYVSNGTYYTRQLDCVFCNDLYGSFDYFKDNNSLLKAIVSFVQYETPTECHGSYDKVLAWRNKGGRKGIPFSSQYSEMKEIEKTVFDLIKKRPDYYKNINTVEEFIAFTQEQQKLNS